MNLTQPLIPTFDATIFTTTTNNSKYDDDDDDDDDNNNDNDINKYCNEKINATIMMRIMLTTTKT